MPGHDSSDGTKVRITLGIMIGVDSETGHMEPIAFLPGIDSVQYVTRIELVPTDLLGPTIAGNDTKPSGPVLLKFQLYAAALVGLFIPDQRQVVKDCMFTGNPHIVRHPRAGQFHRRESNHFPFFINHSVMHVGKVSVVVEKDEFVGAFVGFRMG